MLAATCQPDDDVVRNRQNGNGKTLQLRVGEAGIVNGAEDHQQSLLHAFLHLLVICTLKALSNGRQAPQDISHRARVGAQDIRMIQRVIASKAYHLQNLITLTLPLSRREME